MSFGWRQFGAQQFKSNKFWKESWSKDYCSPLGLARIRIFALTKLISAEFAVSRHVNDISAIGAAQSGAATNVYKNLCKAINFP